MDEPNGGGSCGKRKKRDRNPPVEDDDADDESKMEKFFDLIHNLGQSLKGRAGWAATAEKHRDKAMKGGWEPRFQLQDFARDHGAVAFNDTTAPPQPDLDLALSP